jgi:hypothetical protein
VYTLSRNANYLHDSTSFYALLLKRTTTTTRLFVHPYADAGALHVCNWFAKTVKFLSSTTVQCVDDAGRAGGLLVIMGSGET